MNRFAGKADLTGVLEASRDTRRDGLRDVRIFQNDESIGAAQFHHGHFDHCTGFGGDCGAGADAPGNRGALDPLVINDVDDVFRLQNQILKHSFRKTGFQHHALQLKRTPLCVGRVLHQEDIAGQQRRNAHSSSLPQREVPRHNSQYWPERQIRNICFHRAGCGGGVCQYLWSVLGVPLGLPSALLHLGFRLRKNLAHLQRDCSRQLCLVLSQDCGEL